MNIRIFYCTWEMKHYIRVMLLEFSEIINLTEADGAGKERTFVETRTRVEECLKALE